MRVLMIGQMLLHVVKKKSTTRILSFVLSLLTVLPSWSMNDHSGTWKYVVSPGALTSCWP